MVALVLLCFVLTAAECVLVVLCVQVCGVLRHLVHVAEKEVQSGLFPPSLPSLIHCSHDMVSQLPLHTYNYAHVSNFHLIFSQPISNSCLR